MLYSCSHFNARKPIAILVRGSFFHLYYMKCVVSLYREDSHGGNDLMMAPLL